MPYPDYNKHVSNACCVKCVFDCVLFPINAYAFTCLFLSFSLSFCSVLLASGSTNGGTEVVVIGSNVMYHYVLLFLFLITNTHIHHLQCPSNEWID